MTHIRRVRALLAELNQVLDDIERELIDGPKRRPRKRPVVPVPPEAKPPQETLAKVRRAARRAGVAA
jgi:hypothetical protein